jgi:dolichol-phosphate mannosyltransferase
MMPRLARFGAVGASGVGVNLTVFSLLSLVLHMPYLIAAAVGIEVAICSNFMFNNRWTFGDMATGWLNLPRLARHHAVCAGGMLINMGVLHVLASVYGQQPLVANMVGIGAATCWNFSLSIGWTWRKHARAEVATA